MTATATRPDGRTYQVQAPEIVTGLRFRTTHQEYEVQAIVADFGSGVVYARVRKISGPYTGNDVYLRLRPAGAV